MQLEKLRRSATWGKTHIVPCALFLSSITGLAQAKLSRDVASHNQTDQVDVIVQFKSAPTSELHHRVLHHGGFMRQELGLLKAGSYHVPASVLAELAADPDVAYVSPDRPLFTTSAPPPPGGPQIDHHRETVSLPANLNLDGTGIGVAVIDSGIAPVTDITANRVVYSQDFTGQGNATDTYGHGTHIAGIIAGNGAGSTGSQYSYTFKGLASNVNLINLRVLDQNGAGTDAEVIAAIQQAIALKAKYNIRVINLSLGRSVFESYALDPLCQAVEQAWKAGIVVVTAAGNYGRDNNLGTYGYLTITAPGNDPYVITVGAMNTQGNTSDSYAIPTSYTSKGPSWGDWVAKPDLVAPGNMIVSLYAQGQTLSQQESANILPTSLYQNNGGSNLSPQYIALSGTSTAAPMVTGAVALMLQQNPKLTPDQVKLQLMTSADKTLTKTSSTADAVTGQVFYNQADIFTVGAGYLDVNAALTSTVMAPPTVGSAQSANVGLDSSGYVVLVNGTPSAYGPAVFSGNDALGLPIIWGINPQQVAGILPTLGLQPGTVTAPGVVPVTTAGPGAVQGSTVIWGSSAGAIADRM